MKTCQLLLVLTCFSAHLYCALTQEIITSIIPDKVAPALADRVVIEIGDDHNDNCSKDRNSAQTKHLIEVFARAESRPDERYHVMVEAGGTIEKSYDRHGVLIDLLTEVKARNFKNTTFKDIDFRLLAGAAHKLLSHRMSKHATYLDEDLWIEKLKSCPIMSIFPAELQTVTRHAPSEIHERRYRYAYAYFGKLTDKEEEEKFEPILWSFHQICEALLFVSRARESFPCDLRTLTFQHIIDEYDKRLKIAWKKYDKITDPVAKDIYKMYLEGSLKSLEQSKDHINARRFAEVDKQRPILDISLELAKNMDPLWIRKSLNDYILDMFADFIDLDLFYKVIKLEQRPEIKKIIVLAGTGHTLKLDRMLRETKRYERLMYEFNERTYLVYEEKDGIERRCQISTPLRVYLVELMEPPRRNLEWEIWLRKWLYSLGWHMGITK